MSFTLSKTKLAGAVVATSLLVPATAYATHVFDDVPDGKFYAEPVEWAYDNSITTGKTPTQFDPEGNVTRGESVTFLKRYDDNIVQPALDDLADDIAAAEADATAAETAHDEEVGRLAYEEWNDEDDWDGNDLRSNVTIEVPTDGYLIVSYSANIARDINESGSGDVTVIADLEQDETFLERYYQAVNIDGSGFDSFVPQTLAFTQVLEATAGENQVDVTLSHGGGATDLLFVYSERLNVLFVPFDSGVTGPIIALGGGDDTGRNPNPGGNDAG